MHIATKVENNFYGFQLYRSWRVEILECVLIMSLSASFFGILQGFGVFSILTMYIIFILELFHTSLFTIFLIASQYGPWCSLFKPQIWMNYRGMFWDLFARYKHYIFFGIWNFKLISSGLYNFFEFDRPRILWASWISLGIMVTRFAWIVQRFVSSKSPIR